MDEAAEIKLPDRPLIVELAVHQAQSLEPNADRLQRLPFRLRWPLAFLQIDQRDHQLKIVLNPVIKLVKKLCLRVQSVDKRPGPLLNLSLQLRLGPDQFFGKRLRL